MKSFLLVVLAAAAAWGQSAYTGTSTSAGSSTWGVSIPPAIPADLFGNHVHAPGSSPVPTIPLAGLRVWDMSGVWRDVSPSGPDGVYNWATLDNAISYADTNNMQLLYTVVGAMPRWITQNAISSISRSGNVVTATVATPVFYTVGASIDVAGVTDSSFNGDFTLTVVNGGQLQWSQTAANASSSGGNVAGNCSNTPHPGSCWPPLDVNADGSGADAHLIAFIDALMAHTTAIPAIECANEPNQSASWNGTMSQLARMCSDIYARVKTVQPSVIVTSPAPSKGINGVHDFFQSYLAEPSTPANSLDVVAFHTYSYHTAPGNWPEADDVLGIVSNLQTALSAYGVTGKPLWTTEWSWGDTSGNGFTDQDLHAGYLAQRRLLDVSAGISRSYFYAWDNGGGTGQETGATIEKSGLADGQIHDWLIGASLTSGATENALTHNWSLNLVRPGGYQAMVLWNRCLPSCGTPSATATTAVVVDSAYIQAQDLDGDVTPIAGSVLVGYKPVLIETESPPSLQIAPANGQGARNQAFALNLQTTGGTAPFTWKERTLPSALAADGLSLNSATGVISGIPPNAASFNTLVGVQDASGMTASQNISIQINP